MSTGGRNESIRIELSSKARRKTNISYEVRHECFRDWCERRF